MLALPFARMFIPSIPAKLASVIQSTESGDGVRARQRLGLAPLFSGVLQCEEGGEAEDASGQTFTHPRAWL